MGGDAPGARPHGFRGRLAELWANRALRFVTLFLVYLVVSAGAYPWLRERFETAFDWMMLGTAYLEYYMFLPFTDTIVLSGKLVTLDGFSVKIIEECTGIYEAIIFGAAVLAFPTTFTKKAIGFGFGIPMIYAFNLLRIVVLIVVGRYWPQYFDFMHLYFWQATLIAMITSVWALWIFKVVIRDEAPATHP